VLNYFSESFQRENCNQTCDNCLSGATFEEKDLTEYAAAAVRLVKHVENSNVTLHQCVDAFRGASNAKLKSAGLENLFGFGKDLERENAERVFTHLLEAQALREESKSNNAGFATNYVKVIFWN
jgi:bloom syndrome protein